MPEVITIANTQEVEQPRKFRKSAELLAPGANPLLRFDEKVFILLLIRGTSFSSSRQAENIVAKGISPETQQLLKDMITDFDGRKKPFSAVINEFNSKNTSDSPIDLSLALSANILITLRAGVRGDLESVIRRASEGKVNCLEFALIMQLIGKVYYPDEVSDVQLLGFTEKGGLFKEAGQKSRHFYLFTQRTTEKGEKYYLTTYGGREHETTKEEAQLKADQAAAKNDYGVENIYRGFITLIERSENIRNTLRK